MKKKGEAGEYYGGAGEGVTNLVLSVPFRTICYFEVTNRVGVTDRVGKTSNLTEFVNRVTNRVGMTNRIGKTSNLTEFVTRVITFFRPTVKWKPFHRHPLPSSSVNTLVLQTLG